jgi:hypothetical protein
MSRNEFLVAARETPMTKSHEKSENEITVEAKREATRTGRHICDVLDEMLARAKIARNKARQTKIVEAQKFLGCRNKRKRRKLP